MDRNDLIRRLHRWARWSLSSGEKLGFPSMSSFMRDTPVDGIDYEDYMADLECIETNDAVMSLQLYPRITIIVQYLSNCNSESSRMHLVGTKNARTYRKHLEQAYIGIEHFFDKKLTHRQEKVYKSANL